MSNTDLVIAASAEAPHVWGGASPYWVGAITLVVFLGMIALLVAFGNGREHS